MDGDRLVEVINYSLTQDATSMDLSDPYTGVGQISADIQETADTRYLLSREFTLNDFVGAEHIGLVQQINSRDGVTSLIAEDVLRRLNVDRYVNTARAFDTEITALEAIIEIFALAVGFEYDFRYVPGEHVPKFIMFPGGKVNLWSELKEFAAVYKFDLWVEGKILVIDNLGANRTEVSDLMAEGWSADISNVANWVEVIWFDNAVKGQGDTTQVDLEYYPRGNNEDAQILQADASETVEVDLDVNAWVYTWNQPQCVEWVDDRVYDNTQGVYSVVGNDNLPITPSQWLSNGGSLTVESTDDPAIVKVILKGANIPELAPFRIAMSSGNHYNSLHLTGWAYVWEKKTTRIYTGAGSELTSQEMGAQMESRHVQSLSQAYDVAYRVARSYAGPNLSLDVTSVGGVLPGTIMTTPDANFRVEQRVVGPLSVELRTGEHSTFEDFNRVWERGFEDSYTYEWESVGDASASIAKYNEDIIARNMFSYPKPQTTSGWEVTTSATGPITSIDSNIATPSGKGLQVQVDRSTNWITDNIRITSPPVYLPPDAPDRLYISMWSSANFKPKPTDTEWVVYPVDSEGNRIDTIALIIWSMYHTSPDATGTIGYQPSPLTSSFNWGYLRNFANNLGTTAAGFRFYLLTGYEPHDVPTLELKVSSLMLTNTPQNIEWFDGDTPDLPAGRIPTFADFNNGFDGMLFQDFATSPLRRNNG